MRPISMASRALGGSEEYQRFQIFFNVVEPVGLARPHEKDVSRRNFHVLIPC